MSKKSEEQLVKSRKSLKLKRENNLVSDTEYLGLTIQNLANELQILNAKYDLISATNEYYYGTMGQLNIE